MTKIGSMPLDTLPAKSEMVPVGAIEVRSALRMPCWAIAGAEILGQATGMAAMRDRGRASKSGKAPFSRGERDAGAIGGGLDQPPSSAPAISAASRRAVAQAAHGERIGKAGQAEPDAAFAIASARCGSRG